ncbi:MAG TPA: cytochrome c [Polyangiaceae bacterium]|nr:cytochrome c [Polyangiaceae bacterium]
MNTRLFALFGLLALGCAPALAEPNAADATAAQKFWPEATLTQLEQGRELYVQTCASCHPLKLPGDLPPERWREEVGHMRELGVKLADSDAELITRYLETISRRQDG